MIEECQISSDTLTLIGLGVAAVVIIWLVFSVLKKVIGLLFLGAVAFGTYMLWKDPVLLNQVLDWVQGFIP